MHGQPVCQDRRDRRLEIDASDKMLHIPFDAFSGFLVLVNGKTLSAYEPRLYLTIIVYSGPETELGALDIPIVAILRFYMYLQKTFDEKRTATLPTAILTEDPMEEIHMLGVPECLVALRPDLLEASSEKNMHVPIVVQLRVMVVA